MIAGKFVLDYKINGRKGKFSLFREINGEQVKVNGGTILYKKECGFYHNINVYSYQPTKRQMVDEVSRLYCKITGRIWRPLSEKELKRVSLGL